MSIGSLYRYFEDKEQLVEQLRRRVNDELLVELTEAMIRSVELEPYAGTRSVLVTLVDGLELTAYAPWHATRADLLRRLGRDDDASRAYAAAIATTLNPAERAWLASRRGRLGRGYGGEAGTP